LITACATYLLGGLIGAFLMACLFMATLPEQVEYSDMSNTQPVTK